MSRAKWLTDEDVAKSISHLPTGMSLRFPKETEDPKPTYREDFWNAVDEYSKSGGSR